MLHRVPLPEEEHTLHYDVAPRSHPFVSPIRLRCYGVGAATLVRMACSLEAPHERPPAMLPEGSKNPSCGKVSRQEHTRNHKTLEVTLSSLQM